MQLNEDGVKIAIVGLVALGVLYFLSTREEGEPARAPRQKRLTVQRDDDVTPSKEDVDGVEPVAPAPNSGAASDNPPAT